MHVPTPDAPKAVEKVPAVQPMQTLELGAAVSPEKVPWGHSAHAALETAPCNGE